MTVRELPLETQVSVRMDAASLPAVEAQLGSGPTLLRLGPDEWLVVAEGEAAIEAELRAVLTGDRDAIVDVSDQRTTFELAGPYARELLAMGCSLDLHPRAFGPGQHAVTMLARAGVILLQLDDAPTYRVMVRRSFAAYVAAWLADAMTELG